MDDGTIDKIAEATKSMADASSKLIDAFQSFGGVVKGPVEDIVGMVQDRVRFARWSRQLALIDKARAIMHARGLTSPSRNLPLNFAVPLLTTAVLEEDDELQEIWARLLVNAGDATTQMELRTAFVEILRGMSAFDVRNLSLMAEATLGQPMQEYPRVVTTGLPHAASRYNEHFTDEPPLSPQLGVSLANLSRLGCAMPGGGWGGVVVYSVMSVTDLGEALYKACS